MNFSKKGLEDFVTDRDLEAKEGIWVRFAPGKAICCLRAGGSNRKYQKTVSTVMKPHQKALRRGTLDPEITESLMHEIYSKAVVIDWEGIEDETGKPVPCTKENVFDFFQAFPEIFEAISDQATDANQFLEEQAEATADELGKV